MMRMLRLVTSWSNAGVGGMDLTITRKFQKKSDPQNVTTFLALSRVYVTGDFSRRGYGRDRNSGGGGFSVSQFCVKLRGMPWSATKDDIADFLERCNIVGGHRGIILMTDDRGRPSGDAYVEVESSDDVDMALKMHKRDMGSRYVEVFEANPLDVDKAKNREDGGGGGSRGGRSSDGFTVQLRGLPYKASVREISDWLSEAAYPDEVNIIMDRTGRPSGQADAIFSSERDARRVVSIMHKRDMGPRYVECYYDEDMD